MISLDMFTSIVQFKKNCKRHLVVIVLASLAIVEAAFLSFVISVQPDGAIMLPVQQVRESIVSEPVLKISEIRGSRIDDDAAMIVVEESATSSCAPQAAASACSTLPLDIWVFLLIAFVTLLVFNFSYTFKHTMKPQWGWEASYMVLFIIGWYAWDGCRDHVWFPFAVVKFSLIVFALYAYLLEKKLSEKTEKTTSLL